MSCMFLPSIPEETYITNRGDGSDMKTLEDYVITIPDFPKKGIMFRDITSIITDKDGFKLAIDGLLDNLKNVDFDAIVCAESRGFIFGAPIAYELNKKLVIVRKKGKLPRETISEDYDLEYGSATIEVHRDSVRKGDKVVIIDDLIATGGTTMASVKLVERLGGEVVKIGFIMELKGLNGRQKLEKYEVFSLIQYPGI